MATNKTLPGAASVSAYLQTLPSDRGADCTILLDVMAKTTGQQPVLWGSSIIGFGKYAYTYASGHKGEAPLVSFASRANAIVLYLHCNSEHSGGTLQKLGKFKQGKGCIYVKQINDIDLSILRQLIQDTVAYLAATYHVV